MVLTYKIHELTDYINWIYFFHAWGFQPRFAGIAHIHGCDTCRALWLRDFPDDDRPKAAEAMQLFKEAQRMLWQLDEEYRAYATFRLCRAYADGDNLLLDDTVFPLLRQQSVKQAGEPCLCLSDFVRPLFDGIPDTVGIFATTVDNQLEQLYENDPYRRMLVHTLTERLAEAAAERMHEQVRKEYWGYAKDENLTISQLLREEFQGIRPAVGYPSLPDQSVNFVLDQLLDMSQIGIRLTEHGMMTPRASVSGLMLGHPQARYFSVGHIGEDQLNDYAMRRGKSPDEMRKFLSGNLTQSITRS